MKGITLTLTSLAVASLLASACTVHQTEAPDLAGPSDAALSLSVTASPDSISQDGRSTSTIAVVARDPGGRPLTNLPFRLDMMVDGEAADYGTLSTRNVVTGSDGRTTAVYTAPPAPPVGSITGVCQGSVAGAPLAGRCVSVVATPVGSDYTTASSRSVEIHLIPTGVIIPSGSTPVASFTATPSPGKANEPVLFDASKSCAGALDASGSCPVSAGTITSYAWSFGDGGSGSGRGPSHTFSREQAYFVTLTVTNDRGLSASASQSITVGAGSLPEDPIFTFSPAAPSPNQDIFFDATSSKPRAGHYLVRFVWNWGDGSAFADSSSPTVSHKYAAASTYKVTLTVADEAGQTASTSKDVAVGTSGQLKADFVKSPTAPLTGQAVFFDASLSAPGTGRTIKDYKWNFGDGSALASGPSQLASHTFTVAGSYVVVLTITDDVGQTAVANQTVTVTAPAP